MSEETIPAEPARPPAGTEPTLAEPAAGPPPPAEHAAASPPPGEHAAASPPPAATPPHAAPAPPIAPPPPPPYGPAQRPGQPWARRGPRWLPLLIVGLVGLLVGCVLGGGIGFVAGHFGPPRGGHHMQRPGFDHRRGGYGPGFPGPERGGPGIPARPSPGPTAS